MELPIPSPEEKLRQWITDNGEHIPCSREGSKYGCLMCQELYKIIDELKTT